MVGPGLSREDDLRQAQRSDGAQGKALAATYSVTTTQTMTSSITAAARARPRARGAVNR